MKLKDIIYKSAAIIGLDVDTNTSSPALTKLMDCANAVYSLLVLEFVPLKTKEQITFRGGRAYYADFRDRVREVIAVRRGGERVDFRTYPQYVEADLEGEATVEYLFYTGTLSPEDEVILPPVYTDYVMALGVAAEYYYRVGFIDEAEFYKSRYDNAVANCNRSARPAVLARRRFLC